MFRMSEEEGNAYSRKRRSNSERDFLASSIDSLLASHYKNQDAVLEHQTELIQTLVKSHNLTNQMDSYFFNIIDEIRQGYSDVMEDITKRVISPSCPTVTPVLYFVIIGFALSMVFNVIFLYLRFRAVIPR